MTVRTFIFAALASATIIGSATADERINVTPTLYRDQARATASVRPASELTTVVRLVPAAPTRSHIDVEATGSVR